MTHQVLPCLVLLCTALALADDSGDRAKLVGEWTPQDNEGATWIFRNEGDDLHVTEVRNDEKLADFGCNTVGRECDVKSAGRALKVSMWYSGPKLVVMETRGSEIVKHRFHAVDENKLEVEVIPIVPNGKSHSVNLVRRAQTTAHQ